MSQPKYDLKHINCSLADYMADRHRFAFVYNEKEYTASCYSSTNIVFYGAEKKIPEDILCEIQNDILDMIDKNAQTWEYPKEVDITKNEDEKERECICIE